MNIIYPDDDEKFSSSPPVMSDAQWDALHKTQTERLRRSQAIFREQNPHLFALDNPFHMAR